MIPRVRLIAGLLLATHFALAANSLVRESPTVDEVVHLPAGVTYWQSGSFKVYHHNPPLVKLVAALPVVLSKPDTDDIYASPMWKRESVAQAMVAQMFLLLNTPRYFELFTRARLVMPVFSLIGGIVVFAWSRRLYGDLGALLSLALWCFCPNILAHARLITSDVGSTALGAGATFLFWLYLREPFWRRAIFAGLALGVAQLSKFSLLTLYGLWPVLWLVMEAGRRDWSGWGRHIRRAVIQGTAIVAISVAVIDAGYLFEGVGIPLGRYDFACRTLTVEGVTKRAKTGNQLLDLSWAHRVNRFRGTWLAYLPAPLPREYLLGFDDQKIEADGLPLWWIDPRITDKSLVTGYPVYLDGVLRRQGWRDYYVRCLLYKVPEGTWVLWLLSWGVLVASRRSRASWPDEIVLLVMGTTSLLTMTFLTDINLGLRYILGMFPYLFIAAGKLAPWADGLAGSARKAATGLIAAALLATIAATALIHPHYLAYFNALSGGPDRSPPHLIDSNLDWGQDLVNLREWVREHPQEGPIGIAYFGQIPPNIFTAREGSGGGLNWFLPPARKGTIAPTSGDPKNLLGPVAKVTPGLYAISVNFVQGLPFRVDDPSFPSPPAAWRAEEHAFSYFQALQPFERIGHSINLYRVSADDAARLNAELERGGRPR